MSDNTVNLDESFFGSVEIEIRIRRDGDFEIGESRRICMDRHGDITSVSEWEPTGAVIHWERPTPRRWWRFWQ